MRGTARNTDSQVDFAIVQGFEQVKHHVHKMNVYLETNLSDPYGGGSGRTSESSACRYWLQTSPRVDKDAFCENRLGFKLETGDAEVGGL